MTSSGCLRFPVPLDKGNEDSGNEIEIMSERHNRERAIIWNLGSYEVKPI